MTIPELSRHACNIVPYVSRSETLQNLVKLGVNLDVVQRVGVLKLKKKERERGERESVSETARTMVIIYHTVAQHGTLYFGIN